VDEDFIVLKRQSRRRPQFWLKAIFSLGIWLLWWRGNYLALTKRSIVRRTGVFTKEERAIPLNQVQDISISYGIVRRILGHGDIRIETAGTSGTEVIMYNIDKPEEFRAKVFEQIDKFFEDEGEAPPKEKTEEKKEG
jgi:uncharacterized membrane protein YdbT with pleckstrin-like domain